MCGCAPIGENEHSTGLTTSGSSSTSSSSSSTSTTGTSSSTGSTPSGKTIVPAHTLKDSNPPIDVNSKGQQVSEETWNSFRYASSSKFNGNYNYTYRSWNLGGEVLKEEFTKDGYHVKSIGGELFYERKSGNTFYNYAERSDGYIRTETSLNLQDKYTDRIKQEIYVHMYDFSNYKYDSDDGVYRYLDYSFGYGAKFQGGYLTYLFASISGNFYEISMSFETTIDIPQSYY